MTTKLTLNELGALNTYLFDIKNKHLRIVKFQEADGFSDEHYGKKRRLLDTFFLTDKSIEKMPKEKIDKLFLALVDWYEGELGVIAKEILQKYKIEIVP